MNRRSFLRGAALAPVAAGGVALGVAAPALARRPGMRFLGHLEGSLVHTYPEMMGWHTTGPFVVMNPNRWLQGHWMAQKRLRLGGEVCANEVTEKLREHRLT